jgi:hypothetical protein
MNAAIAAYINPLLVQTAMAQANVHSNGAAQTALPLTLGALPQQGNTLIIVASSGLAITSIVGGGVAAGGWTLARKSNTNINIEIWSGIVTTTPSTGVTVNLTSASITAILMEWQGSLTYDKSGIASGTSITPATPAITPTFPGSLIIAGCGANNTLTAGPTGGFTDQGKYNSSNNMAGASLIEGPIVAASTSWTQTNLPWDAVIAAFRP